MVNGAHADGQAQQVTQELHDATIRAAAGQRQPDDRLAQPCLAKAIRTGSPCWAWDRFSPSEPDPGRPAASRYGHPSNRNPA